MKIFKLAVCALISVSSSAVLADRDSSAIDSQALTSLVQESTGVVLKVPINAQGEELRSGTELRVVNATNMSTRSENLPNVWSAGVDSSNTPQVDSSTDSGDSSTWGWNRWNNYYGWSNNCYSNWYQPTYYYYGTNYNYGYYNYYNHYQPYYYNGYNYAGYRYYYYIRY